MITIFTQSVRTSVRPSYSKLQNQATITASRVCGLAEWITDDSCLIWFDFRGFKVFSPIHTLMAARCCCSCSTYPISSSNINRITPLTFLTCNCSKLWILSGNSCNLLIFDLLGSPTVTSDSDRYINTCRTSTFLNLAKNQIGSESNVHYWRYWCVWPSESLMTHMTCVLFILKHDIFH